MKTDNFIAFFTVCGFFMGLIFVVLKATDPSELILYTLLITLFFYLMVHVVIMNYVDANKIGKKYFNKEEYEEVNDYLMDELTLREKRIEGIINIELAQKMTLKKQSKKNERVKAKAA